MHSIVTKAVWFFKIQDNVLINLRLHWNQRGDDSDSSRNDELFQPPAHLLHIHDFCSKYTKALTDMPTHVLGTDLVKRDKDGLEASTLVKPL